MASFWDQAASVASGISSGIDGYLHGTDGGSKNKPPVRNEKVLLDQSQPSIMSAATTSGMGTKTMLMIAGGVALVVVLVMVKK